MTASTGAPAAAGARLRRWRIALLVAGLALLALGGIVLLQEVNPRRYVGILSWFVGALVLHDGVLAPAVLAVALLGRRLRVPAVVVALIEGALVVGGLVTLLVVPEILKQWIGTQSSSILPQPYGLHLAVFWAAIVVLAVIAVLIYRAILRSAQKQRPPSDQS